MVSVPPTDAAILPTLSREIVNLALSTENPSEAGAFGNVGGQLEGPVGGVDAGLAVRVQADIAVGEADLASSQSCPSEMAGHARPSAGFL